MWLLYEALDQRLRQRPPSRSRTLTPPRLGPLRAHVRRRFPRTAPTLACRSGRCGATTTSTAATATSPTPTSSPRSTDATASSPPDQARELGLLDPDGPGRGPIRTCPGCSTPTAKSSPRSSRPSPATPASTARPARSSRAATNPTRGLHFEGDGETAWGTKFVLVAARSTETCTAGSSSTSNGSPTPAAKPAPPWTASPASRPTSPARKASSTTPHCAACTTRHLLRDLGLLPVNRVTAAKASPKKPRRERATRREERPHRRQDHHPRRRHRPLTVALYARGGARRHRRTHRHRRPPLHRHSPASAPTATATRTASTAGTTTTDSPTTYGARTITVRLHGNADDTARKFNRTENVRPIPPDDPDFDRLYPAPQRRRVHQPQPRRHPLAPPRPQHRPRTANTSTSSATRSWSTRSRSTATSDDRAEPLAACRRSTHRPVAATSARRTAPGVVESATRRRQRGPRSHSRPQLPLPSAQPARGFLPRNRAAPAPVAQGIEHRFPKPWVAGSNPAGGTPRPRGHPCGHPLAAEALLSR